MFIQYFAIIESISIVWKRILRNDSVLGDPAENAVNEMLITEKLVAKMFNSLNFNEEAVISKKRKWEKYLNIDISNEEFQEQFQRIYLKNHSKLRSFQYLLLQNAVVTNRKLVQLRYLKIGCAHFVIMKLKQLFI